MQTEPAVIIGAVGTFISALVPLLAKSFGWTDDLAAEWEAVLLAGWTVVSMLITVLLIRQRVYSPATHDADVHDALMTPPPK